MTALRRLFFFFFLLLALSPVVTAEELTTDEYQGRLPENTLVCVSWHDLNHLPQLRATNSLLRFLNSPEMKANWKRALEYRQRARKSEQESPPPGEEKAASADFPFRKLAPLLTNPGFVAVMIPSPESDPALPPPPSTYLYLYDMTGKEEALAGLEADLLAPGLARRAEEFEGVTLIELTDAKGGVSYQARVDHWLLGGGERTSVENWIRAVRHAPERSFKDSPAYQQARRLRPAGSQVEIVVNPSPLHDLLARTSQAGTAGPSGGLKELAPMLPLQNWELFLLSVSLEADRTRYDFHGIHFQDAGGVTDVIAPSVPHFPSLTFAPTDASSYSVVELDLQAVWGLLQAALADLPPQSAQLASGFEGMIEGVLGFPLDELIAAWGQEFSQLSYSGSGNDDVRTVRVLELRDRGTILAGLRNLATAVGPQLNLEELAAEPDSGVAYFRLGPASDQKTTSGLEPDDAPGAIHAGVTDRWLLIAPSREDLDRSLAQAAGGSSLSDNAAFQHFRGRFPRGLSTFSFVDAERLLASGAIRDLVGQIMSGLADANKKQDDSQDAESEPAAEPRETFEAEVPTGYLKWWVSGTSRDEAGLHHLGYIE